jgi:two-component system chemotaxis response regulator CheY
VKILVVDDSKAMRMIVARTIAKTDQGSGAEVLEATNGAEALALVRDQRPDLVLSDWNMPEMTGIELLEALNREGLRPAFGFVTSESTPEMYERAMASGARFLVTKPFTPESLGRALAGG